MTPQETALVNELFDRLAALEAAPRDPAAERLIAEGLQRAPHALYALVQTALVQDEALKRADARIAELQAQTGGAPASEARPAGFLDSMRAAFAGSAPRGSVPSVHASAPAQGYQAPGGYPPQAPAGFTGTPGFGGGSFLGTAASAAAGVIGGSLLLDGIRSMFGPRFGGYGPSPFGNFAADQASPWATPRDNSSGSAADSDLARQAGIDHIDDAARGSRTDQPDAGPDPFAYTDNSDDAYAADGSDPDDSGLDSSDFGDMSSSGDNYDA